MTWAELCEDTSLHDLPYRIETNAQGQIIMSPTKIWHSRREGRIAALLARLLPTGEVVTQPALHTHEGTKVADVSWYSDARIDEVGVDDDAAEFLIAGEIMVEVLSYSNSDQEMTQKRELYFGLGAQEVWLCDLQGIMSFWTPEGQIEGSKLCPEFPKIIARSHK